MCLPGPGSAPGQAEPNWPWPRAIMKILDCINHGAVHWNCSVRDNSCGAPTATHAAILASVVALLLLAVSAVALYQWREAAWQRDRALAQKRLALEAISQLTHEVPLRLRNIPGHNPAGPRDPGREYQHARPDPRPGTGHTLRPSRAGR